MASFFASVLLVDRRTKANSTFLFNLGEIIEHQFHLEKGKLVIQNSRDSEANFRRSPRFRILHLRGLQTCPDLGPQGLSEVQEWVPTCLERQNPVIKQVVCRARESSRKFSLPPQTAIS